MFLLACMTSRVFRNVAGGKIDFRIDAVEDANISVCAAGSFLWPNRFTMAIADAVSFETQTEVDLVVGSRWLSRSLVRCKKLLSLNSLFGPFEHCRTNDFFAVAPCRRYLLYCYLWSLFILLTTHAFRRRHTVNGEKYENNTSTHHNPIEMLTNRFTCLNHRELLSLFSDPCHPMRITANESCGIVWRNFVGSDVAHRKRNGCLRLPFIA